MYLGTIQLHTEFTKMSKFKLIMSWSRKRKYNCSSVTCYRFLSWIYSSVCWLFKTLKSRKFWLTLCFDICYLFIANFWYMNVPTGFMFSAILAAVSASRPRADVAYCIQGLAKRLAKTRSWTVCSLLTCWLLFSTLSSVVGELIWSVFVESYRLWSWLYWLAWGIWSAFSPITYIYTLRNTAWIVSLVLIEINGKLCFWTLFGTSTLHLRITVSIENHWKLWVAVRQLIWPLILPETELQSS